MHMADALLSPAVGGTLWAGSLATIAWCSKKLRASMDERLVPLMGVLGAFIFAAQMINFTIPGTGSSGHLGGGLILAAVLGPHAAFLVMASVLTVQAFFFADGGLLALGCNIWNLGIYPCFIAYPFIFKPLAADGAGARRLTVAAVIGAVAGLQMGSFSVVIETLLSGRSELGFGPFVMLMQPVHLAIGLVEGFVTAGVINYVRAARPELIAGGTHKMSEGVSYKNLIAVLVVLAAITGGGLSWFASANPDGLEWSIEKVYGKPELPEHEGGAAQALRGVQEKTAFLPDYSFKKPQGEAGAAPSWPNVDAGTSVSGILGGAIVLVVVVAIGIGIKTLRRRPHAR